MGPVQLRRISLSALTKIKMSDERIHRHDWENKRCKVCGVSQESTEKQPVKPSPSEEKLKQELGARLDGIERRLTQNEGLVAVILIVLVLYLFVFRGG